MNNSYRIFILGLLLFFSTTLNAQNWLGYSSSTYAGSNGIYVNPSSIAGSRVKFNFNVASFDLSFNNNYNYYAAPFSFFQVITGRVPEKYQTSKDEPALEKEYFTERLNGKPKNGSLSTEFRTFSFMLKLDKKNSIAFSTRTRAALQAFDVDENFARMARFGVNDSGNVAFTGAYALKYKERKADNRFSMNFNAFSEYNFTYARELYNKGAHYWKGGITAKILLGQGNMFIINKGIEYEISGPDSIKFYNYDVDYGYVREANYYDIAEREAYSQFYNPTKALGKGLGADIGVTYEYRPDYERYQYKMDGKYHEDPTMNKYLWKIGASLIDLGSIKYKVGKEANHMSYLSSNEAYWGQIDTFEWRTFGNADNGYGKREGFDYSDSVLRKIFKDHSQKGDYRSKLPMALNLNFDYKITEHFYVNAMWIQSLRRKQIIGMRQQSVVAVTPRYESRFFEASIPLVLANDYSFFQYGFFLKGGPLFIGSDNMAFLFTKNRKASGVDFYAGLSFTIHDKKIRDRDKDKVSDKMDKCISVAGSETLFGCPDKDNDSIGDADDKCPDVKGPREFKGCPDTDGDGIPDNEDSCASEAGVQAFNGCPDRDNDNVPDAMDECPDKPGVTAFNGCPDRDNDNVPDAKDLCPDAAGPQEMMGCPDTDKDGLADNKDLCPLSAGPVENNGCPKVDKKVEILEIPKEEEEVLKEAFDALEFETNKAVIRQGSYASLDELAKLLDKRPQYRIYIAGHTDNAGNSKTNLKLSKDRAEAVKKYLVSKGIDSKRIIAEGFGSTRPVADNKTQEGRQKNRRVEFKVIK